MAGAQARARLDMASPIQYGWVAKMAGITAWNAMKLPAAIDTESHHGESSKAVLRDGPLFSATH